MTIYTYYYCFCIIEIILRRVQGGSIWRNDNFILEEGDKEEESSSLKREMRKHNVTTTTCKTRRRRLFTKKKKETGMSWTFRITEVHDRHGSTTNEAVRRGPSGRKTWTSRDQPFVTREFWSCKPVRKPSRDAASEKRRLSREKDAPWSAVRFLFSPYD